MKYLIGLTIIILALPFLILATITNAIMDSFKKPRSRTIVSDRFRDKSQPQFAALRRAKGER